LYDKPLGRGGFSEVYETSDGYAAKLIRMDKLMCEEHRAGLINEIGCQRILSHRNIIQLIAVYELHGQIVLKLERVRGKTLINVIQSGERLAETRAKKIIR
jgi:serine/threonine protein kinase